jgi:hypothetical protein
MANEQIIRQITAPQDRSSLIERFDPTPVIKPLIEQLLGIQMNSNKSASSTITTYKRVSRPMFSEEYVRVIEGILRGSVNNVISFSKFTPEQIRLRNINMFMTHGDSIGLEGNKHFISEETWQRVLDIHESGKNDKGEGSGWSRYGIEWKYDSPVTYDMVRSIKDHEELVGQEVDFAILAQNIRGLITACIHRSLEMPDGKYGMTSNLIGETTIEKNQNTLTQTGDQQTW